MKTHLQTLFDPVLPGPLPLSWRIFALPGTSLGRWSYGLIAGFAALLGLVLAMVNAGMAHGPKFFSTPLPACTLLAAAGSAIAGAVAAVLAISRKGERSIFMLLPLALAARARSQF